MNKYKYIKAYDCAQVINKKFNIPLSCLIDVIYELPTADVVEVVRCKDCGSYNKHYGECTLNGSHFGENNYCCRGTRTKERGAE